MVYVLPRFIPSANPTHDDQPPQTPRPPPEKPEKEIQSEIQAIIRQITASVTFLPLLEDPCEAAVQGPALPALPACCLTLLPLSLCCYLVVVFAI